MTDESFTQFAEKIDDELEYTLEVKHDGELVGKIEALSVESLFEQTHKLNKIIIDYANERYNELPDYYDREDDDEDDDGEVITNPTHQEPIEFEAQREKGDG